MNDGTMRYEQYQDRLLEEKEQLDEKLAKLVNFIGSATFQKLPSNYCDLLEAQRVAMAEYARILVARVELFKPETPEPELPLEAAPVEEAPHAKGKHKAKYDNENDWKA